jgi:hypothetical protein
MYAEYFRCYDSSDRQAVEDVDERLPSLDITSSFAFIVEAVN